MCEMAFVPLPRAIKAKTARTKKTAQMQNPQAVHLPSRITYFSTINLARTNNNFSFATGQKNLSLNYEVHYSPCWFICVATINVSKFKI